MQFTLAVSDHTPAPAVVANDERERRARLRRCLRTTLVPSGSVLFSQGEEQKSAVEVIDGVLRAVHLSANGDREVLGFFWPGTVICPSRTAAYCYAAEAVTASRLRHTIVTTAAGEYAGFSSAEQVVQELLPLLAAVRRKNSIARLAWFLLRIRRHLPYDRRRAAHRLVLPRADVADYLGMSMETVSRTLADFNQRALIALLSRKTIRFLDLPHMSRIAQG